MYVSLYVTLISSYHADLIKMLYSLQIVSKSDYFIQVVDTNSHTEWQTVEIQISWLLRSQLIWIHTVCKGRVYPGSAGPGLRNFCLTHCRKSWKNELQRLLESPRRTETDNCKKVKSSILTVRPESWLTSINREKLYAVGNILEENIYKPAYDKTYKMAFALSEDSDQPRHPPSKIRVFAVGMKKAWVLSYPLSAQWRLWSDGGCPGWSESSLGACAILLVLSWAGSYTFKAYVYNKCPGQTAQLHSLMRAFAYCLQSHWIL